MRVMAPLNEVSFCVARTRLRPAEAVPVQACFGAGGGGDGDLLVRHVDGALGNDGRGIAAGEFFFFGEDGEVFIGL